MATLQVDTITNTAGTGSPNFPFGFTGAKVPAGTKDIANAAYVITDTDGFVEVTSFTTLTANRAVTLPATATNIGRTITIKKVDSGAFSIQVTPAGADTIDGSTAVMPLLDRYAQVTLYCANSGNWHVIAISGIMPTIQKFTSGSGTYTTPAYTKRIRVMAVGGGGGGAGSSASANTNGGNGGAGAGANTTFGSTIVVANGGSGGTGGSTGQGGAGGTASLGTGAVGTAVTGGTGGGVPLVPTGGNACGGMGAASAIGGGGGAGAFNQAGVAGITNTGGGGGGGGGPNASLGGGGGGAGGFADAIIASPAATYAYVVGASNTAGTAGTSGFAGGASGSGYIEVTEHYV